MTVEQRISQVLGDLQANPQVKRALETVKADLEKTIEVQKELVLIESPTGHEEKRSERYRELLEAVGLEDVRSDEHHNVWGRIKGSSGSGKCVLIEGHLDTVFSFGDVKGITVDEQGRIHCPGICDDTRAIAANLAVAKALIEAKIVPVHDIVFGATVCEEGLGGMKGMGWLLQELSAEEEIIASLSIDGPTGNVYQANATGMGDWSVTFTGPGGHAWVKHHEPSAIHAACRAVVKLANLTLPEEPKTTITASLISGGQAIHGIAQNANFKINFRSNSQEELEKLKPELKILFQEACDEENAKFGSGNKVSYDIEVILDIPAGSQPNDSPIIRTAEAVTRAFGLDPAMPPGGCTNANMAIAAGIPAINFGRGGKEYGTHTLEEWFDPEGVYVCEQKSILMLLALAGLDGVTDGLDGSLK